MNTLGWVLIIAGAVSSRVVMYIMHKRIKERETRTA